jgi:hypothetical protein
MLQLVHCSDNVRCGSVCLLSGHLRFDAAKLCDMGVAMSSLVCFQPAQSVTYNPLCANTLHPSVLLATQVTLRRRRPAASSVLAGIDRRRHRGSCRSSHSRWWWWWRAGCTCRAPPAMATSHPSSPGGWQCMRCGVHAVWRGRA